MSWGGIRGTKVVMVRTPTKIKIPTRGEYALPHHNSDTARISHHRLYSFKCGQTEGVETPTSSNAAELNGRPNHSILCRSVACRYFIATANYWGPLTAFSTISILHGVFLIT